MHNNYYFLRQLSDTLDRKLRDFTFVSCFSQNKDELVIEFNNAAISFFIKASLQPEFQCLTFPTAFHRARKNSVEIFQPLLMNKVIGTRQFSNERSFAILLENENMLVFKMHAARANVIWFCGGVAKEIFRNNMEADLALNPSELDRNIDWGFEEFERKQAILQETYFTLGKPVWKYLFEHDFDSRDIQHKWNFFNQTLQLLQSPNYHILQKSEGISFSLLPSPSAIKTMHDPLAAVNEFFIIKTSSSAFESEKAGLLSPVRKKLKQATQYEEKSVIRLKELESEHRYQQWADLIMANLYQIPTGADKIEVENLYDNKKFIEIKLKKGLSPQKNAEVYYRKSKNQAIEIRSLKESIARKEKEVSELTALVASLELAADIPQLRKLTGAVQQQAPVASEKKSLPYHEFEFKTFRIWVGRNAKANDELTLKYSHKDDLWLHAKDVAGSHVLIKYQSGKPYPKDVIEYAASLAAHYSKRKNESLCPVAYTSKKFVRKRKGDPAGAVVVEREDVIMVVPANS